MFNVKNYLWLVQTSQQYSKRARGAFLLLLGFALLVVVGLGWWAYVHNAWVALSGLVLGSWVYQRLWVYYREWLRLAQSHQSQLTKAHKELLAFNGQVKQECEEKVRIYLQEATEAQVKLQQIQETLIEKGVETTQKLLTNEINIVGELAGIQDKVRREFPDFVHTIDKCLADGKINKTTWQVGYCLKFGKSPAEIAKILPLGRRTISVYGSKLRKIEGLESLGR